MRRCEKVVGFLSQRTSRLSRDVAALRIKHFFDLGSCKWIRNCDRHPGGEPLISGNRDQQLALNFVF